MTSSSTDRLFGANSSLAIKAPCRVATTANITLSANQTIDGVATATGDRVLVKNQTDATENGIYIADSSTWERAPDFDGNRDIVKGTTVRVTDGTVGAGLWRITTSNPIVIDTTSIAFTQDVTADAASVSFVQAGTGAVTRTMQNKAREVKSITDYGADTGNTAAVNTPLIQAAIDANYGNALIIPPGTFLVETSGAVVAPVGNALSITDSITLIFEGVLKGNNNCNNIRIAPGANKFVYLIGRGGGLQGYGTFFEATNHNGALTRVASGLARIWNMKLIDPPQYSVFADSATDGEVLDCDLIGGQATYPGDNNYHVCLVDAATGWKVSGNKTIANAAGGKCSQAIASITLSAGTADRSQIIGNHLLAQWEKGAYVFGDDVQINSNLVYGTTSGEGLRVVGKRPVVNGNIVRSCVSGGITLYNAEGAVCEGNRISGCNSAGITLAYDSTVNTTAKSLSDAMIRGNSITGSSTSPSTAITNGAGIYVVGDNSTSPNTERRIRIQDNRLDTVNYSTDDERAGIYVLPGSSAQTMQDLAVTGNIVNGSGAAGIRFGAGTYTYKNVDRNKVRDPGSLSATLGGGRSAFLWHTNAVVVGQSICDNEARSEAAGSSMTYGFEHPTAANLQSMMIARNHSRGHVTEGYLGMQDASNSRFGNRKGDNSLHGTFTTTLGTTAKAVSNGNIQTTGNRIDIWPLDANALALQASTGGYYFAGDVASTASFTLQSGSTAGGAGTFGYTINV